MPNTRVSKAAPPAELLRQKTIGSAAEPRASIRREGSSSPLVAASCCTWASSS
jgi:hypothetical protein